MSWYRVKRKPRYRDTWPDIVSVGDPYQLSGKKPVPDDAKSWWNAEFRVDDRLRPCKHISLEFPSHIFIVGLSTRVGEQPNCDSTCFLAVDFFAIRLYNCNHSHFDMSDFHSWLSGQSIALCKREIASSDPKGVFLLYWQRSANTF